MKQTRNNPKLNGNHKPNSKVLRRVAEITILSTVLISCGNPSNCHTDQEVQNLLDSRGFSVCNSTPICAEGGSAGVDPDGFFGNGTFVDEICGARTEACTTAEGGTACNSLVQVYVTYDLYYCARANDPYAADVKKCIQSQMWNVLNAPCTNGIDAGGNPIPCQNDNPENAA